MSRDVLAVRDTPRAPFSFPGSRALIVFCLITPACFCRPRTTPLHAPPSPPALSLAISFAELLFSLPSSLLSRKFPRSCRPTRWPLWRGCWKRRDTPLSRRLVEARAVGHFPHSSIVALSRWATNRWWYIVLFFSTAWVLKPKLWRPVGRTYLSPRTDPLAIFFFTSPPLTTPRQHHHLALAASRVGHGGDALKASLSELSLGEHRRRDAVL